MSRIRPLDVVPTIKLKLSVIIIGSILIATLVSTIGFRLGWPVWVRPVISAAIGVAIMWFFAAGIVSPLREMATASSRMARGDYGTTVTATSADEVGDLARAFNAMATALEAVDRDRRDLIAMVSHELRTPITALQANLENVVDGVSDLSDELLATMLTQTERLGRLVSQLLDLSRLESGAIPLDREPVAIASLLEEVRREVSLHHPDQRIEIAIEPSDLTVPADRERLHQVLANVVDNAAKFSPTDEPIRITGRAVGSDVRIDIADRGPGIAPEDASRLFERYQRGSNARSHERGGTGLGLAIAQWVVELHQGSITALTDTPNGCRMRLELPITEVRS